MKGFYSVLKISCLLQEDSAWTLSSSRVMMPLCPCLLDAECEWAYMNVSNSSSWGEWRGPGSDSSSRSHERKRRKRRSGTKPEGERWRRNTRLRFTITIQANRERQEPEEEPEWLMREVIRNKLQAEYSRKERDGSTNGPLVLTINVETGRAEIKSSTR